MRTVVHDTVHVGDTVVVHDTVVVTKAKYYEAKLIKQLYDSCKWEQVYESYEYGFVICCPDFMEKNLKLTSERGVVMEYDGVRLKAMGYRDAMEMTLEEKYRELNKSATTMSIGDNYFLLAGRSGTDKCYFEKDIKMDDYWFYIRVDFPRAYTAYIDPLLQYVKNYGTAE